MVNSSAGVQQGDNLGPLLFATTIHSLLGELKAILGIDLVIGYLDDIVVAGESEAVLRALLVLQRSIPSLGLTLNMAKCELIPLAGPLSTSDLSRFPAQMAGVHSGRFKFLGAPVGDREFAASFVQDKRAAKADVLLTEIVRIDDAQVTHKLLSPCMGTARVMQTSKCLCSAVRSDAQRFFGSLQVGVACPLGLEAAIHTISQYCERNAASTSKIVMTIDFHNAFNSLDRNALLAACRRDFPTLAAWASWCCSVPSRLLYNERVVNSSAGVLQGDNLGPLLFATTIHSLLGELKAILGIDLVIGYLDDIVVAVASEAVLRALLVLQRSIPSLGLTLNMAKCELIPLAGPLSTSDLSRFPAQMAGVHSGRFKFLGAPVGDREFAASFVQDKRAAKADVLLTEIAGIDDAQVTHKLLSRCMGTARVMHAMRTTRPDWMLGQLEHVDKSMAITAETCFGFAMPPSAEVQASLPVPSDTRRWPICVQEWRQGLCAKRWTLRSAGMLQSPAGVAYQKRLVCAINICQPTQHWM